LFLKPLPIPRSKKLSHATSEDIVSQMPYSYLSTYPMVSGTTISEHKALVPRNNTIAAMFLRARADRAFPLLRYDFILPIIRSFKTEIFSVSITDIFHVSHMQIAEQTAHVSGYEYRQNSTLLCHENLKLSERLRMSWARSAFFQGSCGGRSTRATHHITR